MTGHFTDYDRVRVKIGNAFKGRNADVSYKERLFPAVCENMVGEGRSGGFALGAGDADDPVGAVPEQQIRLARYLLFHSIGDAVEKGYARRFHYHIELTETAEIVLTAYDFDPLCLGAGNIVPVRDCDTALKLFQQFQS